MTGQELKTFSERELDEVWSQGSIASIDALYALDMVDHNQIPAFPPGREGIKVLVQGLNVAFPDRRFTADVTLAEGDLLARRWTMRAAHKGPFLGVPATGREVVLTGVDILRISEGQIHEVWHAEDVAGLMEQLGAGGG
jgi:steroid delta-isomerase-like uncharacterized protein